MIDVALDPFVDSLVETYEQALADHAGVDLEEYLPDQGHEKFRTVLTELLRVRLDWSWARGECCRLAALRAEFPQAFDWSETREQLAFEEFRLRRQAGESVTAEEYSAAFDVETSDWSRWLGYDQTQGFSEGSTHADDDATKDHVEALHDLAPGDHWNGFSIERCLGQGSFGRTYLARQDALSGRLVVLKFSRLDLAEADKLARLQHTNVTPIYSIHGDQQANAGCISVICMPYVGDQTLSDLITKLFRHQRPSSGTDLIKALDVSEKAAAGELITYYATNSFVDSCLYLVSRLADALQHCHERGIVHRDIKPANIVIGRDAEPSLIDFNLARARESDDDIAGGTLSYMSPEQLDHLSGSETGDEVTYSTDVYSLGAVLFELLTGEVLFPAISSEPLARAKRRTGLRHRLDHLGRQVTPCVTSILERCLETDPKLRYQTSAQLRDDIRRQLNDQPLTHAPNRSAVESARKFVRRNPRLFSWTSLVGAVAAASLIFTLAWINRERAIRGIRAQHALVELESGLDELRPALTSIGLGGIDTMAVASRAEGLAGDSRISIGSPTPEIASNLSGHARERWTRASMTLAFLIAKAKAYAAAHEIEPQQRSQMLKDALDWSDLARTWQTDASPLIELQHERILAMHGPPQERKTEPATANRAAAGGGEPAMEKEAPKDYLFYLFNGIEQIEQGNLEAAVSEFRSAVAQAPTEPACWLRLADALMRVGELQEAIACFNVCENLIPHSEFVVFQRGLCYTRHDDHERAAQDFARAIELKPSLASAHVNLALARMELQQDDGALTALNTAVELQPQNPRILLLRARLLQRLQRHSDASVDLEAARQLTPIDAQGWIEIGLLEQSANPELALDHFKTALKTEPKNLAALHNIAHVYSERLEDIPNSLDALNRAIQINSGDILARAGRGVLLARMGNENALVDANFLQGVNINGITRYQVACIYSLLSEHKPQYAATAVRLFVQSALQDDHVLDIVSRDPDFRPVIQDERFMAARSALLELRPLLERSAPE